MSYDTYTHVVVYILDTKQVVDTFPRECPLWNTISYEAFKSRYESVFKRPVRACGNRPGWDS